ncbi:response regulator [Actinocrispum wychmicini]|uniref:DNA-binding NarL/FixJ family response regulator n=1 Tax=Actinocrispum wychmicini TaxID=1213861 RepID=A0A4R2JA32_9PSEU|nr:response regulator transcription factor [Actinocrispum wychmicini]TCO55614.1 DNA-binding NarL/FixJ family response regulator [Actinocrispum wychmicini]
MPLRVLVCDRLPIIRDGLCTLLEAEPDIEVVDAADSGIQAIMTVRAKHPDVVLTGLDLRGISGLEMVDRLAREPLNPKPRFVVLAMSDNDEVIDRVLHANVNGLLVKEATRAELSSAVRAAAQGQTMLAPQVAQRLVDRFRRLDAAPDQGLRPALAELTPREREVLASIARGMSAEEVAHELTIGVTTVRTHLYRLRTKLHLRDRAQLVSFAYRAGLMRTA